MCVLLYLSTCVLWSVPSLCFSLLKLDNVQMRPRTCAKRGVGHRSCKGKKTVLLRLKTTQPFFWLCVCVQYTSVCASEARSVMLACVFNKRLRRSVCVKVDVPQPKVFRRFTDPLTFRLIVVPCVFTCARVGRFFFYFSGYFTHISLGIPTFPFSGKLRGWTLCYPFL